KESSGAATGKTPQRMKSVVMLQLAVSLVMLIETSLLLRQVHDLSTFAFGFNPRVLVAASGRFVYRWDLDKLGGKQANAYMSEMGARMPGVTSIATYGSAEPDGLQINSDDIARDGHPLMAERYVIAGPGFFATTGIPVVDGRDFLPGDEAGDGAVILD